MPESIKPIKKVILHYSSMQKSGQIILQSSGFVLVQKFGGIYFKEKGLKVSHTIKNNQN